MPSCNIVYFMRTHLIWRAMLILGVGVGGGGCEAWGGVGVFDAKLHQNGVG